MRADEEKQKSVGLQSHVRGLRSELPGAGGPEAAVHASR
jgi:hypothetical protein